MFRFLSKIGRGNACLIHLLRLVDGSSRNLTKVIEHKLKEEIVSQLITESAPPFPECLFSHQ